MHVSVSIATWLVIKALIETAKFSLCEDSLSLHTSHIDSSIAQQQSSGMALEETTAAEIPRTLKPMSVELFFGIGESQHRPVAR